MYTEAKRGKGELIKFVFPKTCWKQIQHLSFNKKLGGWLNKWLKKVCDVDSKELECPDGQKPRVFKGSDCSSITDGDEFPKTKENKCADADDVSKINFS